MLSGTFAYMADAALFKNCADGQTYPVAMEAAFPEVTRAYRQVVGDAAGSFVFCMLQGEIRQRPAMEGGKNKATLVVERLHSFSRDAQCDTEIQNFSGYYSYMADAATFQDCNGKRYPVAFAGAQASMEVAYAKTGVNPPEPVFVELAGFLQEDQMTDGAGTTPTLHIIYLYGFVRDGGCP